MSKKYVVKRRINKKNTFILLVILISILLSLGGFIKNIFFKEESALADDSIKNESTIESNKSTKE